MGERLPPLCRHGKSALERKLLYYMHFKAEFPIEWRVLHSTGFNRDDIPKLEHPFEFVPLSELGYRIFMFKTKLDRDRARKALDGTVKTTKRRRSKRSR